MTDAFRAGGAVLAVLTARRVLVAATPDVRATARRELADVLTRAGVPPASARELADVLAGEPEGPGK